MSTMHGQEASRRILDEGVSSSYCMCERPRGLSGDCAMSVMRGEEASGMKLHEVVLHAPRLSARLPLLCSSVAGPLLICLSAVALFVCHWSIVGLSLVYHWSARVVVAVLSLVCLSRGCWSVTGPSLSLVCLSRGYWSITGLSLVCHWSVTGLSLVHCCHWSFC